MIEDHRKEFIARKRVGPRLRVEDLSHEDTQVIYRAFMEDGRLSSASTNEEYCRIYCSILSSYGVMCPHPVTFREYDDGSKMKTSVVFDERRWFHCPICDSFVINKMS